MVTHEKERAREREERKVSFFYFFYLLVRGKELKIIKFDTLELKCKI